MSVCRCCVQELERDEMRRQIQQLHECIEQYVNRDDDDDDENNTKIGSTSNNKEDVNPFHCRPHRDSSSSQHQRKKKKMTLSRF